MAAVIYLVAGAVLGALMMVGALWPPAGAWTYYLIPSHAHLMLLWWVSMTMFGVAYRMFPAILSRQLYSMRLAWLHFWVANIALAGMAVFFFLNRLDAERWTMALALAGFLQLAGVLVFAYNILRTACFSGR